MPVSGRTHPRPLAPKGVPPSLSTSASTLRSPLEGALSPGDVGMSYAWPNSPDAGTSATTSTVGKTKRNCVSNACVPCRKKRSKCDGATPCGKCLSTGKPNDCRYDVENDHRRKGALRKRNEELQAALEQKEHQMDKLLRALRDSNDDDVRRIVKRIKRESNLDSIVASLEDPSPSERGGHNGDSEGETDVAVEASDKLLAQRRLAVPYSRRSNKTLDPILSPRVQSHSSDSTPSESNSDADRVSPSFWTNVTTDDEFIIHLIDLYFTWDHPLLRPFSEAKFRADFEAGRKTYCSSMLVNAMCASGCRFSTRDEAYADPSRTVESRGIHFHEESLRQLLEERSSPASASAGRRSRMSRLTTMQAVILISLEEGANCRDAQGELHFITFRNLLEEEAFTSLFMLDPEAEEFNGDWDDYWTIYWCYYISEAGWAMAYNRCPEFPDHVNEKVSPFQLPSVRRDCKRCPWYPYVGPKPRNIEFARKESELYQPSPVRVSLYLMEIFQYITRILTWLYGNDTQQFTPGELLEHYETLMNWRRGLPEAIRDAQSTTHPWVMIMHMVHRTAKLTLLRPFCGLSINFTSKGVTPLSLATAAAKELLQLILTYDSRFGVQYTSSQFTQYVVNCALTFKMTFPDPASIEAYKACIVILQKLATVYPVFRLIATSFAEAIPVLPPKVPTAPSSSTVAPAKGIEELAHMLDEIRLAEDKEETTAIVSESKFYKAIVQGASGALADGFEEVWEPMSRDLAAKMEEKVGREKQGVGYMLN